MLVRFAKLLQILAMLLLPRAAPAGEPQSVTRLRTPSGVEFAVLGENPRRPAPTLFVLTIDAEHTLTSLDYNRIGALLARDGILLRLGTP